MYLKLYTSLNYHKANTKYCLKIQNKNRYKCDFVLKYWAVNIG